MCSVKLEFLTGRSEREVRCLQGGVGERVSFGTLERSRVRHCPRDLGKSVWKTLREPSRREKCRLRQSNLGLLLFGSVPVACIASPLPPLPPGSLPCETGEVEVTSSLKALVVAGSLCIFYSILSLFSVIGKLENVTESDVFQFKTVTNSCIHLVSNYGKRRMWKINGFDALWGVSLESPLI